MVRYFLLIIISLLPSFAFSAELSVDCKALKRQVVRSWSETINQPRKLDHIIMGVSLKDWTPAHSKKLAVGYSFCMKDAIAAAYDSNKANIEAKWKKGQERLNQYINELPKTKKKFLDQIKEAENKKAEAEAKKLSFETNSALLKEDLIRKIKAVVPSYQSGQEILLVIGENFSCQRGWREPAHTGKGKSLTPKHCGEVIAAMKEKYNDQKVFHKQECDELMDDSDISKSEESGYLMSGYPREIRSFMCGYLEDGYDVDFSKSMFSASTELEIEDPNGNEISIEFEQKDMIYKSEMTTVWIPKSIENSDGKEFEITNHEEISLSSLVRDFFEKKQKE